MGDRIYVIYTRTNRRVQWKYAEYCGRWESVSRAIEKAAELMGAGRAHILFREILPSCLSPVFTKMALDVGWVILIGATLSYVGLGAQGNAPALGQMLSDGVSYMPEYWWMTIYPSAAIAIIILGFNLFGDGLRDALSKGDMQK